MNLCSNVRGMPGCLEAMSPPSPSHALPSTVGMSSLPTTPLDATPPPLKTIPVFPGVCSEPFNEPLPFMKSFDVASLEHNLEDSILLGCSSFHSRSQLLSSPMYSLYLVNILYTIY